MTLVAGGLGFIGAHTGRALLDLGEGCVLAQRRTDPVPDVLTADVGERAVVESLDCADLAALRDAGRRHRITGIVHLACAGLGQHRPLDELWINLPELFAVLRVA